ncbi:MAG: hypothetical protein JWO77_767 [Ilumatobacteraceae bacterium]|nr:hypothetical protein [Ilumatobacteraceae bacterium]
MAPSPSTESAPATTGSGPVAGSTADLVRVATGWYLLNRLVGTIALFLSVNLAGARFGWRHLLTTGDGRFYLGISRYGYFDLPTSTAAGDRVYSSIGFFPLLPGLIRAFDAVLPGDALVAATVVCTLAGWAACVAVTLLARDVYDDRTARRAAALIACFPGAFIFSFLYTEGLLVAAVAASLILLRRKLWLWAGVAGAVATLARPSGVAIVAAGAAVAVVEIRRSRTWSALWAPALAATGMASFLAYLWWRTGEATAWFDNQRDFWNQRNNLGGYLIKWLEIPFHDGFEPTDHRIYAFILLALVPILIGFYRRPPGLAITVYVSVSLLITLSSSLGPRPRFLLAAFPLLLPFAHRWRGEKHNALVAVGFGLVALSVVYYAAGAPLGVEHFNFEGPVP